MLDTSVLISLERRSLSSSALSILVPRGSVVAAIELAELRVGILQADTDERRMGRQTFLKRVLSYCPVIPFGEREAEHYSSVAVHLRRAGQVIGERDLQIAATALAGGHELMTYNTGEFRRVPGLTLRPVP